MDGVVDTTKGERHIQILATRHKPPLVFGIIDRTPHATVNRVRDVARDLR